MYCEMCGAVNDDNAKKCKKCGFSFTESLENDKQDFDKNVNKFKEDNYETIRKKNVVDKAAAAANTTTKKVGGLPLPVKIVACLAIVAGIAYGAYYYIQTNNFFIPEKNEQTGETRYIYKKNGYKILNAPLYLRGKNYRVDINGYRMEDEFYTDNDNNEYYYDKDGVMKENEWFIVDGGRKFADAKGIILKNQLKDDYYLDADGNMVTDTAVKVGNDDYYFSDNGRFVREKWVNDHFYGRDGKMLKNTRSTDEKKLKLDQNGNIVYDPTIQIHGKNYRFGSTITFGSYEQDGNEANGPEPIEWYLLQGHQDEAILLAKRVLLAEPFQIEEYANNTNNEYKTSYVGQWLNGHFYDTAFDSIDKKYVKTGEFGKVFIPSAHELEMHVPNQMWRVAYPVKTAEIATEKSKRFKSAAIYWLRDNGANAMHKAFVTDAGDIITDDLSSTIRVSYGESTVSGHTNSLGNALNNVLNDQGGKIAGNLIESAVSALAPGWLAGIINATDLPSKAGDALWGIISGETSENEAGQIMRESNIPDNAQNNQFKNKTISEVANTKLPERSITNPYKDVGLITNKFIGVRPMILIDIQANNK